MSFECKMQQLNAFISLGPDRSHMQLATDVLDAMTDRMKQLDASFASMYKGKKISGSYADDLKVGKADEFDFVLTIKLPMMQQFTLIPAVPGYVKIQTNGLQNVRQPNLASVLQTVRPFVDGRGFLRRDAFANWIHYLLDRVFERLERVPHARAKYALSAGGRQLVIGRSRSGPAQTLSVCDCHNVPLFDVDMVFVLQLETNQWVSVRSNQSQVIAGNWHLVPKPYNGNRLDADGGIYWICSYAAIERVFMCDKSKMKNLIRIFKKIRDTHSLNNLKSYYIKTIFLWHDDTVDRWHWRQPLERLFFEMIDKICAHVRQRELLNYWDSGHNLFGTLSEPQLADMERKLLRIAGRITLAVTTKNWDQLVRVILSNQEVATLNCKMQTDRAPTIQTAAPGAKDQAEGWCVIQ